MSSRMATVKMKDQESTGMVKTLIPYKSDTEQK